MNNRRLQDVETIFDKTWKANNYNTNGMKEKVEHQKDFFNRMYNIKPKEDRKKELQRFKDMDDSRYLVRYNAS